MAQCYNKYQFVEHSCAVAFWALKRCYIKKLMLFFKWHDFSAPITNNIYEKEIFICIYFSRNGFYSLQ